MSKLSLKTSRNLPTFSVILAWEMVFLMLLVHKHTCKIKRREEGKEESHMAVIILLNKKDGSARRELMRRSLLD